MPELSSDEFCRFSILKRGPSPNFIYLNRVEWEEEINSREENTRLFLITENRIMVIIILTTIRRGLQCAAQLDDRFQEIWILTDSRTSIPYLANWGDIGDQTSLDILSLLYDLSSGHSIHFQWIPSHVGIEGSERADFLARTAAVEGVSPRGNLPFPEISTISKLELNRQIKTPPSHAWCFAKCPGESFRLSSRPLQSTYSRFLSGHTRALRFSYEQKTFPECHRCSSGEASPNHILLCLGFKKDEVLCDPLLFLDFLQIFGFMGIV
ncbi:RNase H domain-containing protein [Trichonephila clavipes]|nr:RNase H domain-containing protein [Trichonephila clavipes]